jgi:LacI family transcriptional regulator
MGYSLLLADSGNDENRETALLDNMFRQYIDGMLVIYTGHLENHPLLHNSLPKPIVFVDREVDGSLSVATDNYAGGRMAAQHLLALGHKRFGILAGDQYIINVRQRIEGFQDELNAYGPDTVTCQVVNGPQSIETGYNVHMLMASPTPPTALFATNDIIALGAWHKLNELGLHVPKDISLVGYDNIDIILSAD